MGLRERDRRDEKASRTTRGNDPRRLEVAGVVCLIVSNESALSRTTHHDDSVTGRIAPFSSTVKDILCNQVGLAERDALALL
jgi:hypothetical protein